MANSLARAAASACSPSRLGLVPSAEISAVGVGVLEGEDRIDDHQILDIGGFLQPIHGLGVDAQIVVGSGEEPRFDIDEASSGQVWWACQMAEAVTSNRVAGGANVSLRPPSRMTTSGL